MPYSNQSYLDPNAQRNSIAQTMMGIGSPPPQVGGLPPTPAPQMPAGPPPGIPQQGLPNPQIAPPGAPPMGQPLPQAAPMGLPIPPRPPVAPGVPSPLQGQIPPQG